MRIIHYLLFLSVVALFSCNSGTTTSADKPQKATINSRLSKEGTTKLMELVTNYYALKNALVATNATKTGEVSKQLAATAEGMAAFIKSDSTNAIAIQPYLDTIIMQSKIVAAMQDPTCEHQRIAFSPLSNAMYSLLKSTNLKNAGVYKQYCPMAFNDKGAYWLSEEEEIKNPYFGKKMLECGEVQDSL